MTEELLKWNHERYFREIKMRGVSNGCWCFSIQWKGNVNQNPFLQTENLEHLWKCAQEILGANIFRGFNYCLSVAEHVKMPRSRKETLIIMVLPRNMVTRTKAWGEFMKVLDALPEVASKMAA